MGKLLLFANLCVEIKDVFCNGEIINIFNYKVNIDVQSLDCGYKNIKTFLFQLTKNSTSNVKIMIIEYAPL